MQSELFVQSIESKLIYWGEIYRVSYLFYLLRVSLFVGREICSVSYLFYFFWREICRVRFSVLPKWREIHRVSGREREGDSQSKGGRRFLE